MHLPNYKCFSCQSRPIHPNAALFPEFLEVSLSPTTKMWWLLTAPLQCKQIRVSPFLHLLSSHKHMPPHLSMASVITFYLLFTRVWNDWGILWNSQYAATFLNVLIVYERVLASANDLKINTLFASILYWHQQALNTRNVEWRSNYMTTCRNSCCFLMLLALIMLDCF